MLSTLTKCLAMTDPDVFVIKAIEKIGLGVKSLFGTAIHPFTVTIGGLPLTLITFVLGGALIAAYVFEYQMKHNDDFSIALKKQINNSSFTKKILIISGLITIIIFIL